MKKHDKLNRSRTAGATAARSIPDHRKVVKMSKYIFTSPRLVKIKHRKVIRSNRVWFNTSDLFDPVVNSLFSNFLQKFYKQTSKVSLFVGIYLFSCVLLCRLNCRCGLETGSILSEGKRGAE